MKALKFQKAFICHSVPIFQQSKKGEKLGYILTLVTLQAAKVTFLGERTICADEK